MANKTIISYITVVMGLLVLIYPAAAAINTISAGNTVFIGEQGLDISSILASGTQIGWWASGASISGSSPDHTINVPDAANFYIAPGDFSSYTGSWYVLPAKTIAFNVVDPQIDLKVEDTTVGVDVTNKWVPTDDELRFRLDTNLVQMAQRIGYVPVTIKVQAPDGGIYSALISKAGTTTSLIDYHLTTTPQYTGAIWGTSNRATYLPGTYTIWVECNVNSMKDNYGQSGKTVSSKVSLLNQDKNPLIGNSAYVTNPPTVITTVTSRTPTPITTTATTSVITSTPQPVATLSQVLVTTSTETIPTVTSGQETSAVPTKSPGFGSVIVIFAAIFGFALYSKKKE